MENFRDAKLWVSLIATLVGLGILELSEAEQAALVQAIVAVVGGVGYVIAVAIAQTRRQTPAAVDRNLLTDAWQQMSLEQAKAHTASMDPQGHVEALTDSVVALNERVRRIETRLGAAGDGGRDRER